MFRKNSPDVLKKDDHTLEVQAETVEKAIKKALSELKADKKQVDIKVVKEGHKGLFGMGGAKPAKVIVSLRK